MRVGMRFGSLGVLVILAVPMLTGTSAQGGERTIEIQAFDAGHAYYFMLEDGKEKNPTLTLRPGERVVVNLRNIAHNPHNVHFDDPLNAGTHVIDPGQAATVTFTVPEDASGESAYWCEPHRRLGMKGAVHFGEPDEGRGLPGFGAVAALGALAAWGGVSPRRRG